MRTLFFALILSTVLSIAGCKKSDPAFSGAKVITTTNFKAGYTDTYSYDGNGNVAVITRSTNEKRVFTYTGDTVLMQSINGAGIIASAIRYLLHGQKYADTSYGLYQAQNNSSKYAYNSDGQLTQQKNYAFGSLTGVVDLALAGKNLTSTTTTNTVANTHTYSYYSYATNTNTIGNQNFGMGFLGVGSLYLPLTQVQTGQNGDTTGIITYRYHYNPNTSNVDTLATYDRLGHLVDSMAYTY